MNKIVPTLIFLISFTAQSECNKNIDPKQIMLFVDTNNSDLEIATTVKAACERGQRLVIVPKNYKDYTKYTSAVEDTRKKYESCEKTKNKCSVEMKRYSDAIEASKKFVGSQRNINDQVQSSLEEIKNSGAKLQNITISGHDGGGIFSGHKGEFSREDFAKLLKNFPEINEVKSLLLLGCYTGVPKEVIEWKHIFPNIKIIAGYDGSAPLSDRPHGHQYISDILLKENLLLKNADQKKLQNFTKQNIRGLTLMNASMYLECNDGTKEGEFYYGSLKEGKSFRSFDIKECEGKKEEVEYLATKISMYSMGEMEPPKDSANGDLRKLYNQARQLQHCGEILDIEMDMNTLFNLLFYEGVKKNYANFYKEDLDEAKKIFETLKIEDVEVGLRGELENQKKAADALRDEIQKIQKDPGSAIAAEQKILEGIKNKRDRLFNDPAYAQVKNYIDPESGDFSAPENLSPALIPKAQDLMTIVSEYSEAKANLEALQANPSAILEMRKQELQITEKNIETQNLAFEKIKENINKPEKRIWVPNSENLSKKTRAETLVNINNIHEMLTLPGLPDDLRKALAWTARSSANHLAYFQNPFSWHDYTGRTEVPAEAVRLKPLLTDEAYALRHGYRNGRFGHIPEQESDDENEDDE